MLHNAKKKSTKICQFLHHARAGVGPGQYPNTLKTTGASHFGLAIYIKKYLKEAKERIMKTQIFHHAKIYLLFKKIL